MTIDDTLGAFINPSLVVAGAPDGPLGGLRFAAKDLYDVAGQVTGAGNPDWARTHPPASAHAPVVAALLAAGASLTGKTHTDELAYSLNGENIHYGTPRNSAAPDRVPGGSSSGSAAAVAGRLVDAALGTDTGGSVRVPASHCGILGIRTTHGRIDTSGITPLAPSFDTVGWFAREAGLLARLGEVLLGGDPWPQVARRLVVADDAVALADPAVRHELEPVIKRLAAAIGPLHRLTLAPGGLAGWMPVFRTCQGFEAWQAHGAWITATAPRMAPDVAERFRMAAAITAAQHAEASAARVAIRARLAAVLEPGDVLCIPTTPGPAPRLKAPAEWLNDYRGRALSLTCIAGLCGLPQVSLPLLRIDGAPVGVSLLAREGGDRLLLALAARIMSPG
ncbi:MAG: amidase [Thalassobaculales bacterium]